MSKVAIDRTDYEQLVQNSQLLEQYNNENIQLKKLNHDYCNRLVDLENNLKKLQEQLSQKSETADKNIEYFTDEEDLEKETQNVNRQSNKRRRKDKQTSHTKTEQDVNKETEPKKKSSKPPLPPPINVNNINDFKKFREKILESASSAHFKAISASDIKITVANEEEYRKIKKLLEEHSSEGGDFPDIGYYTYQLKSEKSFRAVIRGLPPTCDEQDITDELKGLGHEVTKTSNIIKKINNKDGKKIIKKFPLFLVEMKQKDNNKEIFNIKTLQYCKITVEAPYQAKGIPQCQNCQQLGHTKNFCKRVPICVKCAGKHLSSTCNKKQNVTPKCALCLQEGHTANFKGCSIYQKKIKSQNQQSKSTVQRLRESKNDTTPSINPSSGLTYAQVTKNTSTGNVTNKNNNKSQTNEQSISEILKMLTDINRNIGQLSNRLDKLETNPTAKNKKNKKNQKHQK